LRTGSNRAGRGENNDVLIHLQYRGGANRRFLIASKLGTQLFCQFFSTFEQLFDKPGVDFYEVLDKQNTRLVIGHVQLKKEGEDYRIVYRSNHVGDPQALLANRSFRNFISFSLDMVGAVAHDIS
jgi:hypothetical protein